MVYYNTPKGVVQWCLVTLLMVCLSGVLAQHLEGCLCILYGVLEILHGCHLNALLKCYYNPLLVLSEHFMGALY